MSETGVVVPKGPYAYVTFAGKTTSAPAWFSAAAREHVVDVYLFDVNKDAWRTGELSAKKARKFAKALLALADKVDPPAPKVEYYRTGDHWDHLFRIVDDGRPDLWIGKAHTPRWEQAWAFGTAHKLRTHPGIKRIRRRDVPEEAR